MIRQLIYSISEKGSGEQPDDIWDKSKGVPDEPKWSQEDVWNEENQVTDPDHESWEDVLEWEEVPDVFNHWVGLHIEHLFYFYRVNN